MPHCIQSVHLFRGCDNPSTNIFPLWIALHKSFQPLWKTIRAPAGWGGGGGRVLHLQGLSFQKYNCSAITSILPVFWMWGFFWAFSSYFSKFGGEVPPAITGAMIWHLKSRDSPWMMGFQDLDLSVNLEDHQPWPYGEWFYAAELFPPFSVPLPSFHTYSIWGGGFGLKCLN